MSDRMAGKTALITGAAQGIGYAIAKAYLNEGAHVIITDINEKALEEAAGVLNCKAVTLNVTDADSVQQCAVQNPAVDVLVNCAGYVHHGTILECDEEAWERSMSLNVSSMVRTIRAFLPGMLERQSGAVINIASVVSSVKGAANRCAYASSKAAVIGLTKSVALDFIDQGVRCNSISPGTVESPSLQARMEATGDPIAARKAFIERQPMGRLGQPSEIASVAIMLASEDTAFMTGANVVIDGGWSI